MKVILLKDIQKLGKKYDVKEIAEGYALNYLIPRGLAVAATAQAITKINIEKEKARAEEKMHEDMVAKSLSEIKHLKLVLKGKANDKGHLFAGITKDMLVAEIQKSSQLNIDSQFIKMDKPIKEVGEHKVAVEALGKKAEFLVLVEPTK